MTRVSLLLFGLLTAFWAAATVPEFRKTVWAREVSARIIADDRFKSGLLRGVLARIQASPRRSVVQPEFRQAEALVALRTAEDAMQRKTSDEADHEIGAAKDSVRASLSVTPADSLLWLLLYSVEMTQNGLDPRSILYLDQSYVLGPHEGWIALRRNRLGLAIFSELGEVTRDMVVSEFAGMVDAGFIPEAAMNLEGVGFAQRGRLLAGLSDIDMSSRKSLAKQLSLDGVKMLIPGVDQEDRPWR